jgi:hypothetical protein
MTAFASNRRSSLVRRFGAVAAFFALGLQLGCHSYLPTGGVSPTAGTQVRVALTDAGRAAMADQLGESVDWVQGTLFAVDSASLTVDVTSTRSLRGSYASWMGDRVVIPVRGVSHVLNREFSRSRTVMLSGAIVVGLVAVAKIFNLAVFGDGRPGSGGPCLPPDCSEQ